MIRLYFRKDETRMSAKPTKEKVAVIGTGLVGRCWAIVFGSVGFHVDLYDQDAVALARAIKGIEQSLADLEKFALVKELSKVFEHIFVQPDLSKALTDAE